MFGKKRKISPPPVTWEEDHERNRHSRLVILGSDVFEDWNVIKNPSHLCMFDLCLMFKVAFARGEPEMKSAYANRVKTFIDRALKQDLFEICHQRFPRGPDVDKCRAEARVTLGYAELVLSNRLDSTPLAEYVAEAEQWLKPDYGSRYLVDVEYDYLRLVLMSLVCGKTEKARELFELVGMKKRVYNQYFRGAIEAILESPEPAPDLIALRKYLSNISYALLPAGFQEFSIPPVVHQFELGLLGAVLDRQITLPDCDLNVIVDIVNPPKQTMVM